MLSDWNIDNECKQSKPHELDAIELIRRESIDIKINPYLMAEKICKLETVYNK